MSERSHSTLKRTIGAGLVLGGMAVGVYTLTGPPDQSSPGLGATGGTCSHNTNLSNTLAGCNNNTIAGKIVVTFGTNTVAGTKNNTVAFGTIGSNTLAGSNNNTLGITLGNTLGNTLAGNTFGIIGH